MTNKVLSKLSKIYDNYITTGIWENICCQVWIEIKDHILPYKYLREIRSTDTGNIKSKI